MTKRGQNNQSGKRGERRVSGKQESKPQWIDFIILPKEFHKGVCDAETKDVSVLVKREENMATFSS